MENTHKKTIKELYERKFENLAHLKQYFSSDELLNVIVSSTSYYDFSNIYENIIDTYDITSYENAINDSEIEQEGSYE